jgi:AraC-like DNA-binding protein
MSTEQSIQNFSTQSVPQGMRFDYWLSILRQSLWPVNEWTELPKNFNVELREASFGTVVSMSETISPHRSYRSRSDVDRSLDRFYLLFANEEPWVVAHNGHMERVHSGDAILIDSDGELETVAPTGFQGVILKLPVDWMKTWLPDPKSIVGRRIAGDSKWGRVFSPIVSQYTPELAAAPPLPHGVLVDQLGVTLALIAGEFEAKAMPDILKNVKDCISQRCTEPQLTAADVAASLQVPVQLLHKVLAASNLSFASQLLEARTSVATKILTSRSSSELEIAEVGRQAGFLNASHFTRVVRKRTGQTPQQLQSRRTGRGWFEP